MITRSFLSKLTLSSFAWSTLVAPTLAAGERERIYNKYRAGVVVLTAYRSESKLSESKSSLGTGFFIRDNIIITNEHVVHGADSVYADYFGMAESGPCVLIDSNPDLDLAAIRPLQPTKGNYPTLNLSDDVADAKVGADICIIGHPVALKWSLANGFIGSLRTVDELFHEKIIHDKPKDGSLLRFQLDVNSTTGMSGAPVINANEKVIGIQYMGSRPGETGINFCIPADYVHQLKLTRKPRPFGGGKGPTYQGNNQSFGLDKPRGPNGEKEVQPQPSETGPRSIFFGGTEVQPQPSETAPMPDFAKIMPYVKPEVNDFNISTRTWGFVPNDSNAIYKRYIEDQQGFAKIITKPYLDELIERGDGKPFIAHLTNSFFRYSFLMPNWFHIEEFPAADSQSLRSVITLNDPKFPDWHSRLFILSKKIHPPAQTDEGLLKAFKSLSEAGLKDTLGLRLIDPKNPPPNPDAQHVIFNAEKSDTGPRINSSKHRARSRGTYTTLPQFNKSYSVVFGLSGDSFVAMVFQYPTDEAEKQANHSRDYIERLFIAASLSFLD